MSKKMITMIVLGAFLILSGLAGLIAGLGNPSRSTLRAVVTWLQWRIRGRHCSY